MPESKDPYAIASAGLRKGVPCEERGENSLELQIWEGQRGVLRFRKPIRKQTGLLRSG